MIFLRIEGHQSSDSLLGKAIQNGFNSHFVITNAKGECVQNNTSGGPLFNEIVISQESQVLRLATVFFILNLVKIVPAFLFQMTTERFDQLITTWSRGI